MAAGDVLGIKGGSLESRQCAAFDGTDDYILVDAHAVARVAAADTTGTYSAWVYIDLNNVTQTFLSAGVNASATEYLNFIITSGKLQCNLYQNSSFKWRVAETNGSIINRKWNHVAIVQNGIRPELYINGKKIVSYAVTSTDLTMWYANLTSCDKFAIGVVESNGTHTADWSGMISDVKYWNKPLTNAEVLADYMGEALSDDGTYLQLHLLKGSSGITDQGLGAKNGTLTGNAYLCGWGNEWSRGIKLSGCVAADNITSVFHNDGTRGASSVIIKAA